jgi:hypothetical protein
MRRRWTRETRALWYDEGAREDVCEFVCSLSEAIIHEVR